MPSYPVRTPHHSYSAIVEPDALSQVGAHVSSKAGRAFVVTTQDVWNLHGKALVKGLSGRAHDVLFFPGGEERKRLAEVETLAEEMVGRGADRTSVVIGFGGGIVTDVAGFLSAIFMRGVPVLQVPTTLLAQVDAAIGGKTGVNLVAGKNLIGAFHQPLAVLIDPDVLATLPEREYRAGLFEVLKAGIIRSPQLFDLLRARRDRVLARDPEVLVEIIGESVRIKAEVVSKDEKESDLRRILNFGHTVGHALEAETKYARFLHGEAVAFGMRAAVIIAERTGHLSAEDAVDILGAIDLYGPIPPVDGVAAGALAARLLSDKKTIHGRVHFVLPEKIGQVAIVSGIDEALIRSSIEEALA